jgi:hypothetical protein
MLLKMLPPGFALRVASPLVLVLIVLAGAYAFATLQAHTESPQVALDTAARAMARSVVSALPGAASMPATPVDSESDRPPLGNDGDSEEDGTGDAFEVLAMVGLLVLLSCKSRLLFALCEGPAKPSSIYSSASERPG